jgi:hypothetical protein
MGASRPRRCFLLEKGISIVLHGDALVVRAAHVPQSGGPTFTFFELSTMHSPRTGRNDVRSTDCMFGEWIHEEIVSELQIVFEFFRFRP